MNPSPDRLGEIIAGHRLGRDALVLLGWSGEDIPAQGMAIHQQRQTDRGRFGSLTLADDQKRRWFLLVIHAPDAGLSQSGDGFQLRGAGVGSSTTAYVPPVLIDADAFAAEMLARLGARTDDAARFLMDIFLAMSSIPPEPLRVLVSAVQHAATEIAGEVENRVGAAPQPRFTGQDTVSGLSLPVRMVVDLAARVAGAGWYVTGWLLDPAKLVSAVTLRGLSGAATRLDTTWTRLSREDVSDCYRGDPLFDGRIADDLHGFSVFVAGRPDAHKPWIELDVAGHGCAYMPVTVTHVRDTADRQRLLATVDLRKAAAVDIIERQLGPLFHARATAPKAKIGYRALRQGPWHGRTALIVPLTDGGIKSRVVVARLAQCTLPHDTQLVLVCSPAIPEVTRQLLRDLDFYGLAADILVAAEPVDDCEALEIGAQATSGANLVFMSPRVHAISPNWLADLIAALGDGTAPCAVSPTLLYEDGSLRYAGIDAVEFSGTPPYGTAVCTRAGYPRDSLTLSQMTPTVSGVIECCAMTRSAFASVGGFSQGYALDGFKGVDLFLRMSAAGVRLSWLAGVELYALDDPQATAEHSARVGCQVDGWCFKVAWQEQLSLHGQRVANDLAATDRIAVMPRVKRPRSAAAG